MASLGPMLLGCLSLLIELPRTLPWIADNTVRPRLCSVEEAFILGLPSWTPMTKLHLFTH